MRRPPGPQRRTAPGAGHWIRRLHGGEAGRCLAIAALVGLLPVFALRAQAAAGQRADSSLRVFLDCGDCRSSDFDYFRGEIGFVDFVRAPEDANLHILITDQSTGSGGTAYTLDFLGRGSWSGLTDTLSWAAEPAATQDDARRGLVHLLKLGLVRFAMRTPAGSRLTIGYQADTGVAHPAEHDPWHAWVFEIGGDLFLNGEQTYHSTDLSGRLSARRITDRWKISISSEAGYHHDSYLIDDTTTVRSESRFSGLSGLVGRSLGPRWSVGMSGAVTASTYINEDLALQLAPALEYDFYPYDQSTRRLISLRYAVGVVYYDYTSETLYDRTRETRGLQSLTLSAEIRQPFGSIDVSLLGSNYLHDWSKNRLQLSGNLDVRLVKGLALRVFGDVSLIHDQLYLPKEGATEEEVLLRRRQLATGYRYFTSVGLTYTFGSIHNNVVNPRLGGGDRFFY